MLVGILADSHDHLTRLERALARLHDAGAEALLHAGDMVAPFAAKLLAKQWTKPRAVVYGNNDGERKGLAAVLPDIEDGPRLVEFGGVAFGLFHYPPEDGTPPPAGCAVHVFGHTHQPRQETRDGVLWLNPGEVCGWVGGRPTIMLFDTATRQAALLDLE